MYQVATSVGHHPRQTLSLSPLQGSEISGVYTQCYSVHTSHISLMSDLVGGREGELGNYSLLCCMCTIPLRESPIS